MITNLVSFIIYKDSSMQRFWTAIDALGMRSMILTLLPPSNEATLVLLLASIFNLSFLIKSLKMIHTDTLMLIKVSKDIFTISIYAFNGCDDLCCFGVKA